MTVGAAGGGGGRPEPDRRPGPGRIRHSSVDVARAATGDVIDTSGPRTVPGTAPGPGSTITAARGARRPDYRPPPLPARPPIGEDPSILGFARRSRSRVGSRLFTGFFVLVFALIAVQLVVALLMP